MPRDTTRVKRKLESGGIRSTLRSIWTELYLLELLMNEQVMDALHDRYELPVVASEPNCIDTMDETVDESVEIPDKIWVDGDMSFGDVVSHSVPTPSCYVYGDCYLFVPSGLGITATRGVIPDTIASDLAWTRNRYRTYIPKLFHDHGIVKTHQFLQAPPAIDSYDVDLLVPVFPYWENYYHWTAECLPKLYWVQREALAELGEPQVAIPSDAPSWMHESLELLGVDEYLELDTGIYTAAKLVIPTYPEPSPEGCRWFRTQALSTLDLDETESKRIYISREQANRRRVANRDEIMKLLSSFGFESYVLEELSVAEQAKLFANAEVVVSPHGAGLTNLMYARDTAVIELFGQRKKTTFYRLATLLGFDYQAVTGRDAQPDIYVAPETLRTAVENVCK